MIWGLIVNSRFFRANSIPICQVDLSKYGLSMYNGNVLFEWDKNKAKANKRKHGVGFEEARQAFNDHNAVELFDELNSEAEARYQIIALSPVKLLFVSYTLRDEKTIRIISARKADADEERIYNEYNR